MVNQEAYDEGLRLSFYSHARLLWNTNQYLTIKSLNCEFAKSQVSEEEWTDFLEESKKEIMTDILSSTSELLTEATECKGHLFICSICIYNIGTPIS